MVRETNELNHSRFYTYDAVGNLTQRIDRNGRVIEYAYDDFNRVTMESWYEDIEDVTADREIAFTYHALLWGRLLSSSDPDHQYTYQYDRLDIDRPTTATKEIAGLTPAVSQYTIFDFIGRVQFTGAEIGNMFDFIAAHEYDNLHRMTSVLQSSFGTAAADKRIDFTYDLAGQFDTLTRYADVAGTEAVAVTKFSFDFAGRLTSLTHETGDEVGMGGLLAGYAYTWNQRSQLTAIDFLPDGINSPFDYSAESVAYSYDNRHQLEEADYVGLTDESYEYDENGNRISGGFTVGANNRLLSDGTYDYEYDNEGNRVLRTHISTGDYTVYIWDHRNRLVSVLDFDANGTPTDFGDDVSTQQVDYGYDANNQLIKRVADVDGATGSAPIEQTIFLWQQGQIVLQFDKSGSGDVEAGDLSHRYLWGPAVDQLLADEQVDWTDTYSDGEVLWALTDHLGTVRDIIDNEGDVLDHATYDSFGNRLNAAAVDVVFGFTGKLFDEATGLQNNWHRWYDPAVGKLLSEDPIGFAAWDANLSRYAGNSPTMFVDPSGLDPVTIGGGPSVPIEQTLRQAIEGNVDDLPPWIMPQILTPEEMGPSRWPAGGVWSDTPGNSWFKLTPNSPPILFTNGFPDFSTVPGAIHWENDKKAEVTIELDKSEIDVKDKKALEAELERRRKADGRKATAKMRELLGDPKWKPPAKHAWHHVDSTGRMQLVHEDYHKLAHRGGANLNFRELVKAGKVKVGGVKGKIKGGTVTFGLSVVIVLATGGNEGDLIDSFTPIFGGNAWAMEPPKGPMLPRPEWWEAEGAYQATLEYNLQMYQNYVAYLQSLPPGHPDRDRIPHLTIWDIPGAQIILPPRPKPYW